MTPKEKAQELYIKYNSMNLSFNHYDFRQQALRSHTKQCATIAVNEIIEATKQVVDRPDFNGIVFNTYWQEVKAEIQSL